MVWTDAKARGDGSVRRCSGQRSNLSDLRRLAPDESASARVRLLREFDPASYPGSEAGSEAVGDLDVPDPYYGGPGGFDEVLDFVSAACVGLLAELRASDPA